jgi:hypothetical protein
MKDDLANEQDAMRLGTRQRLPLQAAPITRGVVSSAISSDAGAEASDYNDPAYFFLNWPTAV